MSNETVKKNSHGKLAQAVQDAALLNINEDIQSILDNLDKIVKDIPEEAEKQIASLKEGIASLEAGLKAVPEQFDIDFSRKMNRILDVVSEIELHTQKLNRTIQQDNSTQISKQAEQLANEFGKNVEGYSVTSNVKLFLLCLSCALIGGIVSGVTAWVVIPQLF